jgi:hypothetical protein
VRSERSLLKNSKFSKNAVIVEIIRADVDVTFIDLSGIVAYQEKISLTSLS